MMPEPAKTVEPEDQTAEAAKRTAAKKRSRSEAGGGDQGNLFFR